MNRSYVETLIGFIVVAVAVSFALYAYKGAELDKNTLTGYTLNVSFDRMDGLNLSGDVKVSGIKIGTIIDTTLDTYTYQAKVKLNIDDSVKLPDDSSAEIISAGLLGDKYIAIVPGGSETYFKDNDKIKFSQSSISLEALIGKFMFGGAGDKEPAEKDKEKSPF